MSTSTRSKRKQKRLRSNAAAVAEPVRAPVDAVRTAKWTPLQSLQAFLIIAVGCWTYAPMLHAGWYIDDNLYLTSNPLLSDPWRLWKAWFEPGSFIEYYPLQESVQWGQWLLWGKDPFGYHITNLALHLINALLVWRLLGKFGLRLAWLGGLIFAIHPMQVESVGWISELKNTLSLTPFLFAICSWLDFDERRRRSDYLLALGLFLMAMLCKVSMAPFPVIILLHAWWKRGRITPVDLKASAPFFLISLVLGMTTIWSGSHYMLAHNVPQEVIPLAGIFQHLTLVGLTASFYLAHAFLPLTPLPAYPLWSLDSPLALLPWLIFAATGFVLWKKRQTWGRHVILGLGFFLISLAPFLGFISSSYMNSTWVMDHFLYFPLVGVIGLAVAALDDLAIKIPRALRNPGIGLLAVVLGTLAFETHTYSALFADPLKLWPYTLAHNPQSWLAHYNRAVTLPSTPKNQPEIISEYEATANLKPDFWPAYNNWGTALLDAKRPLEAKDKFQQTLRIWPQYDIGHFNLGLAWIELNHIPEATSEFEAAIRCNPGYAEAHGNLGHLYFQAGRKAEAIDQYELAVQLQPGDAQSQYCLANVLIDSNRVPEAITHYEAALRIDPKSAEAHSRLGDALLQSGKTAEAKEHLEQALKLKPDFAEAHVNLGTLYFQSGNVVACIQQLRLAVAEDPNLVSAHLNLGAALYQNGQTAESAEQIKEAFTRASASPPDQSTLIRMDGRVDR